LLELSGVLILLGSKAIPAQQKHLTPLNRCQYARSLKIVGMAQACESIVRPSGREWLEDDLSSITDTTVRRFLMAKLVNLWLSLGVVVVSVSCSKPSPPAQPIIKQINITGDILSDITFQTDPEHFIGLSEGCLVQNVNGNKSIAMKDGKLIIDEQSFGTIVKGDRIRFDDSGQVLINDKVRPADKGL
jgi:hypothetical protein